MKKIWLFILWLCTIFFAWNFTHAKDYEFTNLNITANVLIDGTVNIKEDYTANFFVEKHGIIRKIPLNYSVWWKDFHIELSNINVVWKTFTTNNYGDERKIQIWDADKTVIWKQNYPISYSIYGLIRNFSRKGYAELYWDLIWNQRDTNFKNFSTEIILPKPYTWFSDEDFLIKIGWTTKSVKDFGWTIDRSSWDKIIIKYNRWIPNYTKFSLSVKFPNNYFEFDHDKQASLIGHIWDNSSNSFNPFLPQFIIGSIIWWITIIILVINKFWKKIRNWRKKTKLYMWTKLNTWKLKWEYAKQFPVIIQYNPPERKNFNNYSEVWLISNTSKKISYKRLNSTEVWLLLHREAKAKDLLSLIYKRAYEKYVEIKSNADESITITTLQELPNYYPEYEKHFFQNLIPDSQIIIKKNENLYEKLNLDDLEQYWVEQQWFIKEDRLQKESKNSGKYWCIRFSLYAFTFFLTFIFGNPLFAFLGFITMFLWLIITSKYQKKMKETERWAELISKILWYREFIAKCDEHKLRLFLEQDPLYFDKILPYAIVFGLDTVLIDKISPIMQNMNIKSDLYIWDFNNLNTIRDTFSSVSFMDTSHSSYSSDGWFDSWSSFDSDFWSDSWGGWGGWSSW